MYSMFIHSGIYELPLTAVIYLPLFTWVYENCIVLSLCIFEPTVYTLFDEYSVQINFNNIYVLKYNI